MFTLISHYYGFYDYTSFHTKITIFDCAEHHMCWSTEGLTDDNSVFMDHGISYDMMFDRSFHCNMICINIWW